MASQEFRESLLEVYYGEQFGEAVFETLLQFAEDDEQRYVMGSLLQLETEARARMRPVLVKLGLSIADNPDSRASGVEAANAIGAMGWLEKFAVMVEGIKSSGLPKYEAQPGAL